MVRVPGWAVDATLAVAAAPTSDLAQTEAGLKPVPNGTLQTVAVPAGLSSVQLRLPMTVRVQPEQVGAAASSP